MRRSWLAAAVLLSGCATAPLLPSAATAEAVCAGRGSRGRAEIRCSLPANTAVKRIRLLEAKDGRLVLGAESAATRPRRVLGVDVPVSADGLAAGTWTVVLRSADGDRVAGSVEVLPLDRGEAMDRAADEVYGP